jgi:hypothetical protein
MARIYISSTFQDLQEERNAAAQAIRRLRHEALAMEDYVAEEQIPLDKCLADIRACQAFIGVYAFRYGYIPEGRDKSITHLEYEEAGQRAIPRLLFLLDENAPWPRSRMDKDSEQIDNFRSHLLKQHLVSSFNNTAELSALVSAAVSNLDLRDPTRRDLPPILPYLCDRSDQEEELTRQIAEMKQNKPRRPFICIVHGDELECQDSFVDRLRLVTLPRLLNLDQKNPPVKQYTLDWESNSGPTQVRLKRLLSSLASNLAGNSLATMDEVRTVLGRHESPVMIVCHLYAEYWQGEEPDLIRSWIDIWSNWPDLVVGRNLFVLLCIHYKNTKKLSFFQRWSYDRRHAGIREFITSITPGQHNVHIAILPELSAIPRNEAEHWVREHASEFCRTQQVLPEIRSLYEEAGTGAIPMERIATEFDRLLRQYRN